MSSLIQPQTLKGFRDSLPEQEIKRRDLMSKLEEGFRQFGYEPIDTPALEYEEILLGKGGGETEKQVYRFEDHGGRRVALRYDLTVPLARFTAQHREQLPLPFKRYHMAKVWRGENPQKGRYREFYQCDFDIVGAEGPDSDAEILVMMAHSMHLLGAKVHIKLSHRQILPNFLNTVGHTEQQLDILRLIDKKDKISADEFDQQLAFLLKPSARERLSHLLSPTKSWEEALSRLSVLDQAASPIHQRLSEILERLRLSGLEAMVQLDFSITRGLDYYTGVVFETFLDALPSLGSVCSGGRYDNLAQLYTKERLPGVGASVGLDRLLAGLEEQGLTLGSARCTDVAVFNAEQGTTVLSWKVAQALRHKGFKTDLFTETKKTAQQYAYAEKKRIPIVVIPKSESQFQIKYLPSGQMENRSNIDELVQQIRTWLSA
jgi:histidyl-tRNA synthetase